MLADSLIGAGLRHEWHIDVVPPAGKAAQHLSSVCHSINAADAGSPQSWVKSMGVVYDGVTW